MPPTTSAPSRVVGGPLMLGLIAAPLVFVWFLLRPGYSSSLRKIAFAYAFFAPLVALVAGIGEPRPGA